MFGEDEQVKQLKKRLLSAGCDANAVKAWTKQLVTVKKQLPSVWERYGSAYENLKAVAEYAELLKARLSEKEVWDRERIKELQMYAKDLKRLSLSYGNEFVVSREDKEFQLIYDTVRRLLEKFAGADDARILLLSEVENILALIKEKLERKKPDPVELTFFYLRHKDEELVELPPEQKLKRLSDVYAGEFMLPIRTYARQAGIAEEELEKSIRRVLESWRDGTNMPEG